MVEENREVILYTSDNCKKSDQLRELLNKWGISFIEKNTTKNRLYLKELQKDGIYGTPTTLVGDVYVEGLQKNRLNNLLNH